MIKKALYDEDYFEKGVTTGKSCYMNYRWTPELTIKMAFHLIRYLKIEETDKILDYGCAKGFLVKALRILDIPAYGCDISSYAIANADGEVRHYCKLITKDTKPIPFDFKFDWLLTKDVLEHLDEKAVDRFLKHSFKKANRAFHVIPLGCQNNKMIIPDYDKDPSHVLARSVTWWQNKFKSFGWKNTSFSYSVRGIKDNWTSVHTQGNGFFVLEKPNH